MDRALAQHLDFHRTCMPGDDDRLRFRAPKSFMSDWLDEMPICLREGDPSASHRHLQHMYWEQTMRALLAKMLAIRRGYRVMG
nr:hypothetical protein [Paracoccus saliphilus]